MNSIRRAKSPVVGSRNAMSVRRNKFVLREVVGIERPVTAELRCDVSSSASETCPPPAAALAALPDKLRRAVFRTDSFLKLAAQELSDMNIARLASGDRASAFSQRRLELGG